MCAVTCKLQGEPAILRVTFDHGDDELVVTVMNSIVSCWLNYINCGSNVGGNLLKKSFKAPKIVIASHWPIEPLLHKCSCH